ncbi:MAG: hypothetical protein QW818_00440 [Candidatus Aenigmatarchaeota archaeon]|nr:hypothetical protein [Candidatus Aenigmarchaeota archaeon]
MKDGSKLIENRIDEITYLSHDGELPPDWLKHAIIEYASSDPLTRRAIYRLRQPFFNGEVYAYAIELNDREMGEGCILYSPKGFPDKIKILELLPIDPEKYADWWDGRKKLSEVSERTYFNPAVSSKELPSYIQSLSNLLSNIEENEFKKILNRIKQHMQYGSKI